MSNYRENYFNNNSGNHGWYECTKCGKKLRKGDADIDHIIPQSRGGNDSELNLQCMCRSCNRSKQADMHDSGKDLFGSAGRIAKREVKKKFF